jgi:hypothetical protein
MFPGKPGLVGTKGDEIALCPIPPKNRTTVFTQDRGLKMDTRREPPESTSPIIETDNARQGVTGHNVRYVLGFGTGGVIVLFGLIYFFYFLR